MINKNDKVAKQINYGIILILIILAIAILAHSITKIILF